MAIPMLFRFSLYGFLKNQKYYEPFLILALRERGLSFFAIGLLVGFRQVWVNILEVPSGFIADNFGRRRSMIASFGAYILSFLIFAVSGRLWSLFPGMFFFAVGEAFRTGTHKAMIFDWLTSRGREDERTRVYGFTRSWSQMGSALSVVLAAGAVVVTENYTAIFWLSVIPYAAGIVNFLGYPADLDGAAALGRRRGGRREAAGGGKVGEVEGVEGAPGAGGRGRAGGGKSGAEGAGGGRGRAGGGKPRGGKAGIRGRESGTERTGLAALARRFSRVLADLLGSRPLRRLFAESAVFRGNTTLTKDYLQPLLRRAALGLPFFPALTAQRRTAVLTALVYAFLYLLSSAGARRAHRFAEGSGGAGAAARRLWVINALLFLGAGVLIGIGWALAATVLLALVVVMQNLWRPIMLTRIDEASDGDSGAMVLSIDSQAGSLYVLIFAPLLGLAADSYGIGAAAVFGAVSAGGVALAGLRGGR